MSTGPAVAKTVWTDAEWTLAGDNFTITLSARGFTQYLRRAPSHSPGYFLSASERGGFSFDQHGYTT